MNSIFTLLQVFADTLVKKAYENWQFVIEYDGKALLSLMPKKTMTTRSETAALANFSDSYDNSLTEQHASASISAGVVNGGNKIFTFYLYDRLLGLSYISVSYHNSFLIDF